MANPFGRLACARNSRRQPPGLGREWWLLLTVARLAGDSRRFLQRKDNDECFAEK